MTYRPVMPLLLALGTLAFASSATAANVTAERSEKGVVIKIDGKPFTEYITCSNTKPILWPVFGPTGKEMTRDYPMDDSNPTERKDHPHHRSVWFTHGDINGIDFWDENPKRPNLGKTKHREFVKIESGPQAVVVTRNDWLGPDGKKVLEDERHLVFGTDGEARWIDFDITLKATEGPVKFGDTKEGSMGVRVPGTMKVTSKLGGKLINSHGQTDEAAWGKQAPWVDYFGPVDGEQLGLAIFNHPSSFRFPTYWHVRTYGLFAANPFGVKEFAGSGDGSYTLPAGKSMTLRYRIFLHKGDQKQGKVAEAYEAYAKEKK